MSRQADGAHFAVNLPAYANSRKRSAAKILMIWAHLGAFLTKCDVTSDGGSVQGELKQR